MVDDIVRSLGLLCLGTRLKRIGDRLQADTDAIIGRSGLTVAASQYPYLAAMDRLGPLTVGDLAQAVGVSQPGATRSVNVLMRDGLVAAEAGEGDLRRKILRLTEAGRRAVEIGRLRVWPQIEAAVADLCTGLSGPLLDQLAGLEDALQDAPLTRRGGLPDAGSRMPEAVLAGLARPIWTSLTTRHAALAEGGPSALRYRPETSLFAATPDDEPEQLSALAALAAPGEEMLVLREAEAPLPADLTLLSGASVVQMLAEDAVPIVEDARIERLGAMDAAEMLALAEATKPGPFTLRSQDLGPFWGIRSEGRLVAMAGTRMAIPGATELSGLCTRPDMQGRGLGQLMLRFVAGRISSRGERVFLHVFASNTRAIALYETLGFRRTRQFEVLRLRRE